MSKVKYPLISDRLVIQPTDEGNIWDEKWNIYLKGTDHESIGHLSFKGRELENEVPINIELDPEFRDKGYGAEIFNYMARFVFRFRTVKEITAICKDDNDLCIRALEKADYVFREHKNGMYIYSMKKSKPIWTGIYLVIGLIAGMFAGMAFANMWAGTAIGVLAGLICGYLLDKKEIQ